MATTNLANPTTDATITVRVIKSFEFRTQKNLVLHHLNLQQTTLRQLKSIILAAIQQTSAWKPYRTVELDTIKLYTKAHGSKTTNLIINLDHDDWILDDNDALLADFGLENESEVSFFNSIAYEGFKLNPETKWES